MPYYGDAAPYMAGVLARMFDIDPDGSLLEAAQIRQATASVLGENERLRAALDRERRKAITVQAEVQKKAEADEIHDAIQWALRRTEDTEEKPRSFAEHERRAREQRRMEGDEENERLYQEGLRRQEQLAAEMWAEDEPDEPYAPLPPPVRREANLTSRAKGAASGPTFSERTEARESVDELLNRSKPHTPPPATNNKWQQFALAGIVMCVLKIFRGVSGMTGGIDFGDV